MLLLGVAPAHAAESNHAGDRLAEVVTSVTPAFPYAMRRVDGTSEVTVSFTVNSKGAVTKASVLKSDNPEFNTAALDAIKKWTFAPAMKDGKVVETKVRQTFKFSVDDKQTTPTPMIASDKSSR